MGTLAPAGFFLASNHVIQMDRVNLDTCELL